MQVIIFPNDEGGVSIITPAPNSGFTIEEVAAMDVPNGKPFEIVDDSTLPWDKPRALWEWI
jgi:hypothetical protein